MTSRALTACSRLRTLLQRGVRYNTHQTGPSSSEKALQEKLQNAIQGVQSVQVLDTSGGCGTMYEIAISAEEFRGKPIVKQHQLVTKVLKDDIAAWHGFTVKTHVPS